VNFNRFVALLTIAMVGLYFSLSPSKISDMSDKEIAQIDVGKFELLQFNEKSMMRRLSGESAQRFNERIEVKILDLNEYTREYEESLIAEHATYSEKRLHLHGGVNYERTDDYTFITNRLFYDRKLDFIYVPNNFIMKNGTNVAHASNLIYDRKNGTMTATKISALFDTKGI